MPWMSIQFIVAGYFFLSGTPPFAPFFDPLFAPLLEPFSAPFFELLFAPFFAPLFAPRFECGIAPVSSNTFGSYSWGSLNCPPARPPILSKDFSLPIVRHQMLSMGAEDNNLKYPFKSSTLTVDDRVWYGDVRTTMLRFLLKHECTFTVDDRAWYGDVRRCYVSC